MWRLPLVVISLAAVVTSAAAGAGSAPYSARATTACLMSHKVLASAVPRATVIPAQFPAVAALQISFALIPSQAIDSAWIIFEKDPATATRVTAAWIAYSLKQAERIQGIDQSEAKRVIEASVSARGNAILEWDNRSVKTASRKLIASCLR